VHGFTTAFGGAARYLAPELLGPLDNTMIEEEEEFIATATKASDIYSFGMVGLEVRFHNIPNLLLDSCFRF
jgi:serine/threonine protein kinase